MYFWDIDWAIVEIKGRQTPAQTTNEIIILRDNDS